MEPASTSLIERATNVASDLILENNDAPVGVETLLQICYIRAFNDGVIFASKVVQPTLLRDCEPVSDAELDTAVEQAEEALDDFFAPNHVAVITGTGNAAERRQLDALCAGLRSAT